MQFQEQEKNFRKQLANIIIRIKLFIMFDLVILLLNLSLGANIKYKTIFMQRCSLPIKQRICTNNNLNISR